MRRNKLSSRGVPLRRMLPVRLVALLWAVDTLDARMFSKLDLPQPVGPMIARSSPDLALPFIDL
jgi:hypothetical protein